MEDISLFVLDLVQNSIAAEARVINMEIIECEQDKCLSLTIRDDGKGMDEHLMRRVTDPFFTTRTTRKVGLGIPMAKAAAQGCGGSFTILSRKGEGTQITLTFKTDHMDCPPFGRMDQTIAALIATNTNVDFIYKHSTQKGTVDLDTRIIKSELNGVPIDVFEVIEWIRSYIREGINEIDGGVFS
jgi:anti-sigma regulatory factor (Ser/Thr protein kinase)